MQKITILILVSISIFFNLSAQNNNKFIKINFLERVRDRVDSVQQNLKYKKYKEFIEQRSILYVGKNFAYYTYNEYKDAKEKYSKTLNNNSLDPTITKNKEIVNGALTKLSMLNEFNRIYTRELNTNIIQINNYLETGSTYKKYYIVDTVEKIDWKLIEEKKTILSFSCQKAIGAFRGRLWEVWFTTEIPLPVGPWKLGGLPGLILEAKDTSNVYSFVASALENPVAEPMDGSLFLNSKVNKVSNDEWLRLQYLNRMEFQEKMQKLIALFDTKGNTDPSEEGSPKAINEEFFRVLKLEFELPYAPLEYRK